MVINKLKVQSVGIFRREIELKDISPYINLIVGPNESGKSTLVRALTNAFLYKYSSKDAAIRSLQPWNTQLPPYIEVEFIVKGEQYRLKKRFLHNPYCELEKLENGRFELIAREDQADKMIQEFLWVTGKAKGRNLATLLWIQQGFEELRNFSLPSELQGKLKAILGETIYSDLEKAVLREIERRYELCFTPKTGKPRGGANAPDWIKTEEKIRKLKDEIADICDEIENAEKMSRELDRLNEERQRLVEELGKKEELLRKWETAAEEYRKLNEKYTKEKAELDKLRMRFENIRQTSQEYFKLQDQLERNRAKLKNLQEQRDLLEKELAPFLDQFKRLEREIEELTDNIKTQNKKVDETRKIREALTIRRELRRLKEKLKLIETRLNELSKLKKQLEELPQIHSDCETARKLGLKLLELKSKAESVGLHIKVKALAPFKARIERDGKAFSEDLKTGDVKELSATREIEFEIPGLVKLELMTRATEAKELSDEIQKLETNLLAIFKKYSVSSLEELEKLDRERGNLDVKLKSMEEEIKNLLEGKDLSSIKLEIENQQQKLRTILKDLGLSEEQLPETVDTSAEKKLKSLQEKRDRKLKSKEELSKEIDRKKEKISRLREQISSLQATINTNFKRVQDILKEFSSEDNLQSAFYALQLDLKSKEKEVAALEKEIAKYAENPEAKAKKLREECEKIQKWLNNIDSERNKLQGALEQVGLRGLYSEKVKVSEELANLEKIYAIQKRRGNAIYILNALISTKKKREMDLLIRPVIEKAEEFFYRTTGIKRGIKYSYRPDLQIEGIEVNGRAYKIDEFSTGTKEQLFFLVRLALGFYLSQEERQLVIMDDVMAYTDQERRQRIFNLLKELKDRLQIIILTAHPERYQGLNYEKKFVIPELYDRS